MIVVLSTSWLTYTVIPIYAAMKAIDRRLFEAALDLGAGWCTTFAAHPAAAGRAGRLRRPDPRLHPALQRVRDARRWSAARSGYMLGSLANSLILEQGDWGAGAALNFLLLARLRRSSRCSPTTCPS